METYTVQMAKWRKVKEKGIMLLDTTVKTGDPTFSPTWEMVLDYKNGKIDNVIYEQLYRRRMVQSFIQNPDKWRAVIRGEPVAIACYCKSGEFCHRHLLTAMFQEICNKRNIPFEYLGEIT